MTDAQQEKLIFRPPVGPSLVRPAFVLGAAAFVALSAAFTYGLPFPRSAATISAVLLLALGIFIRARSTVIDPAGRVVIARRAWFLFFLQHETVLPFDDLGAVHLQTRRSGKRFYYDVKLVGHDGLELPLTWYEERDEARTRTEELARVIGVDLIDTTTAEPTLLTDREVGLSVGERAARLPALHQLPKMPKDCRVSARIMNDTLRLIIPPGCHSRSYYIVRSSAGIFFIIWGLWGLIHVYFTEPDKLGLAMVLAAIFAAVGFFSSILPAIRLRTKQTTIDISPATLLVRETGFLRNRTTTVETSKLVELGLMDEGPTENKLTVDEESGRTRSFRLRKPKPVKWLPRYREILARTRSTRITFGQGLSDEELDWLKAVIEQVVAAGAPLPPL